jgi:hypothetical protein
LPTFVWLRVYGVGMPRVKAEQRQARDALIWQLFWLAHRTG